MRVTICTTIIAKKAQAMSHKIDQALALGTDTVELRLDYLRDSEVEGALGLLPSYGGISLVTLRSRIEGGHYGGKIDCKLKVIQRAIDLGARYVDVESRYSAVAGRAVPKSRLILSWHGLSGMPVLGWLRSKVFWMLKRAEIAKLVPVARSTTDCFVVMNLYAFFNRNRLLAFAMGERGLVSRILAPLLGSPFTYACLPGEPASKGQLSVVQMRRLYDRMSLE